MEEFRLNAHQYRFEREVDGQVATLDYEHVDDKVIDFKRTEVPEGLRGQGVGERLVEDALRWARDYHYHVIPSCPFVKGYVEQHPEHQDLLEREAAAAH
jgi:hypothetical protein